MDGLEPPVCPQCHIEMRWYRSELVSDRTAGATVAHHFHCATCGRRAEIKAQTATRDIPPPSKLSRPARSLNRVA